MNHIPSFTHINYNELQFENLKFVKMDFMRSFLTHLNVLPPFGMVLGGNIGLHLSMVWNPKRMREVCMMFICVSIARLGHEDQNQAYNYDLDELDVLFSQPKVKVTKKENKPW